MKKSNVSKPLSMIFFGLQSPKIFFFGKVFQKTDAQVTGFEGLSHF